jgi:hypothetical protein
MMLGKMKKKTKNFSMQKNYIKEKQFKIEATFFRSKSKVEN